MALEQQDHPITAHIHSSKTAPIESMNVSFYYIPHMSSHVEAKRVRTALLPFTHLLVEHHLDLDTRHLTLYHHHPIDEITVALQRLSLGAALQQTLSHYEPLDMVSSQSQAVTHLSNQQQETTEQNLNPIQLFFNTVMQKIRHWIQTLQNKKDG